MAEWMILFACAPGESQEPGGIVLLDTTSNRLLVKLKITLKSVNAQVQEFWSLLADDLEERAKESGGEQVMSWLEAVGSHVIQVSDRQPIDSENLGVALDDLYQKNIEAL